MASIYTAELNKAHKKANKTLHELTYDTFFSAVPLDRVYDAVESVGFYIDPEEKSCILCGRDGQAKWSLFFGGKDAKRWLILSWHKMDESGKYEITTYVS